MPTVQDSLAIHLSLLLLRVAAGVVIELAAAAPILVMIGAIYEKAVVWHTGFCGVGRATAGTTTSCT